MNTAKHGNEFSHVSVLLEEALEGLHIRPDGVYIDGTAGGGGHSSRIAAGLTQGGRLISVDKDPDACAVLHERLPQPPVTIVQNDFRNIPQVLDTLGIEKVDGILLDLGVSSYQLDTPERGFSYNADGPLDMRMSGEGLSAWDIVNTWAEADIARTLWEYSEERFSRQIARSIVRRRESEPIDTTEQLVSLIRESIPAPARRTGGNPAKRTFQALRIAVNSELDALQICLDGAFERLNVGGRFAIITFHSLEDRIVKQKFAQWCKGCICPPDCPVCICGRVPQARSVTRKPILPGEEELRLNPRSHSAKLRVVEKLSGTEKEE